MKKLSKLFLLISIMVCCGQSMAQTRSSMLLGASYPLKEFALYDGFDQCALFSKDAVQGASDIGFNAGLKWYFNVGVKGLGIMLSVDGFYNGPNEALKSAYRNKGQCVSIDNFIINNNLDIIDTDTLIDKPNDDYSSFKYNSTSGYINVPAMLGLNYVYYFHPNFGVFVEAGIGGNLRFITSSEAVGECTIDGIKNTKRVFHYYDHMFSLAYQAGIGFEVSKKFVISCSFYDLGSAVVKGDRTVHNTHDHNTDSCSKYLFFGTVHPVMVLGRIGFMF